VNVGVPREIKDGELRVGLTPEDARALVTEGHRVIVATGAGAACGFPDADYAAAGARVATDSAEVWSCPLIVKVKELQPKEWPLLCAGTLIFGFAQLNRDPALLRAVLAAKVGILAYETVQAADGTLPLLAPMSRIAGRLAPLVGASAMTTGAGGAGVLLSGVDDVPGARVVIVGAGNVGREAALMAARMGARVTVFSRGERRRTALARDALAQCLPIATWPLAGTDEGRFASAVAEADLVIGGVLEPGKLSPKLIPEDLVAAMRRGAVIVDVGIDQGGIAATSRITSISEPTYMAHGVVHYAVPNMPALVARTATLALTAATRSRVRRIAGLGADQALAADPGLAAGLMVRGGDVVHRGLAADAGVPWTPAATDAPANT